MAKTRRKVVGSIYNPPTDENGEVKLDKFGNPQTAYIKLRGDAVRSDLIKALMSADEKKGLSLRLESKKMQLESLEKAVAAGKIAGENAQKAKERIMNIPDFIKFEIVLIESV